MSDTAPTISVCLSGDVMTGRVIDQILPTPGDPRIFESSVKSAERYVELAEDRSGPIPLPSTSGARSSPSSPSSPPMPSS